MVTATVSETRQVITIKDVREAMQQNNRKSAMAMLKQLLQEDPSPDAWYLAAQMVTDNNKKVKYLNRALFMNADYEPAQKMLKKMGVKRQSTSRVFGEELLAEVYRQCDRSPLLRRFPKPIQLTLVTVVVLIFFVTIGSAISQFFQLNAPAVEETAPVAAPINLVSTDEIVPYLSTSSLALSGFTWEELPRVSPYQSVTFFVTDSNNIMQSVEVRVYRSVSLMIQDQESLDEARTWASMSASVNAVLLYPQNLDEATASQLTTYFKAIRG